MHIIHGTWIPDAAQGFVQQGGFYLWVETDAPAAAPAPEQGRHEHPRQLRDDALIAFLRERCGLPGTAAHLVERQFLLPSAGGVPLPSFELLRYVDDELVQSVALAPWAVCCYRVGAAIAALNDLHFLALHAAEDFQLGADLLFWHQYTQMLKGVLRKDQYIPALRLQRLGKEAGKRAKKAENVTLYTGWELLSAPYEEAVRRFAAAMPPICAAGAAAHDETHLFEREHLLRHCAECLLYETVVTTPFTAKFDQQVANSMLYDCIHPQHLGELSFSPEGMIDAYREWASWRRQLVATGTEADFTLCFRLEEASPDAIDSWRMHFLVAAREDPSLKLSLREYWALDRRGRIEAQRWLGHDFEKQVLLALGHTARIYPRVWEGMDTDQPAGYAMRLDDAFAFLKEDAWVLQDAGFTVIVPSWWTPEGRRRAKVRLKTSARAAKGSSAAPGSYFSLDTVIAYQYQLAVDGQPVTGEEWEALVNAKTPLVRFRGQWMEVDRERMAQLLQFWQTRRANEPELSLLELLKVGAEEDGDLEWDHDEALSEMLSTLQDKSALAPVGDPPGLRGTLREYQRRGLAWLQYLERLGLHPCLADDMGLGKTVQVIARLIQERAERIPAMPTLLIAPTSVLGNWRKEIERFAPELRVLVHQGAARQKEARAFADACAAHEVVLTSFALARLDEKLLRGVPWHRLVVDEAQNIKNPQSAQTRAIIKLPARHRMALTGTPVENRLRDLWSIFNFLNPGYLGKEAQFRKGFELPIQKGNDPARAALLRKLVEPFILRRVKTDKRIIDDLPDKVEQKMYCTLTPEQASLYEAVVKDVEEQIEDAEGIGRKGLILATLMRLKQICNHPAQFLQDGSAFSPERSLKLARLGEMVEEAIAEGESMLIFTQFTEIGAALERFLSQHLRISTFYLHGGTSAARREHLVAQFQDPETEPSAFILSLRAGGVGLTLTKANHVFHFDRWWNPAVEDQATDRAFRIGQRKNVFVHKFVALGTIEERLDAMIEEKKRLSGSIVGTDESWLTELDNEAFKELIALQRSAVVG